MLKLQFKNVKQDIIELEKQRITIGRDGSNTVVLEEEGVSGFHAEILTENGISHIADLGSKNGSFVNGSRVQGKQELKPWDLIKFATIEAEVIDTEGRRPTKVGKAISEDIVQSGSTGAAKSQQDTKASGWTLRAETGVHKGQVFQITDKLLVGKQPQCGIRMDGTHISRKHAELTVENGQLKVKDLGSANGTFVNDQRVTEATIRDGDVVRFDIEIFRVVGPGADSNKTMVRPAVDSKATQVRPAVGSKSTRVMETPKPKLVGNGQSVILTGKNKSIGREAGNDVVVDDETVSSKHAQMIPNEGGWKVEDLGSTNGTFVNDKKITTQSLKPGDKVRFGKMEFRFEVPGAEAGAGTKVMPAAESDDVDTKTSVIVAKKGMPAWSYGLIGFAVVALAMGVFLFKDQLFGKSPLIKADLQVSKMWEVTIPEGRTDPNTPAVSDINGDKVLDVVIADGKGHVLALDGKSGKKIFDIPLKDRVVAPAITGDLSGDGIADIIIATNAGLVTAINGDGKILWTSSGDLNLGGIWNRPILEDVNDDDVPDVVVPTSNKGLVALDGAHGWEIWNTKVFTQGRVITSPVKDDFNGDGVSDFAFTTDANEVIAVSGGKERVWQLWKETTSGKTGYASPMYVGTGDSALIVALTNQGPVAIHADSGRKAWTTEIRNSFIASPVGVDANGDGIADVVAIASNGDTYVIDSMTGDKIWSISLGAPVTSSPALVDVDSDELKDIVVLDKQGHLRIIGMARGNSLINLQVAQPTASTSGGQQSVFIASPVMADLAGDSLIEIVMASTTGKIINFEINRGTNKNQAIWPVFLGNDHHGIGE